MIRAPKLTVSRPMYAFDPDSFDDQTVRAVWFKRKQGGLVAVMGQYRFFNLDRRLDDPTTYGGWVALHSDNRYGGQHIASWDGESLTTEPRCAPDVAARRLAFLETVLAANPDPPQGYDGWWTFERSTR